MQLPHGSRKVVVATLPHKTSCFTNGMLDDEGYGFASYMTLPNYLRDERVLRETEQQGWRENAIRALEGD